MTKKKPKSQHKEAGAPTKMTKEVVDKLEHAFMRGFNDEQASFYAGIDKSTLYNYCKLHPEFSTKKEILKSHLVMQSKINVFEAIESGSVLDSKWLLERKAKDEFSLKTETEHSGEVKSKVVYIEKEEKENYKKHINQVIDGD
jgi:hypothetical protein